MVVKNATRKEAVKEPKFLPIIDEPGSMPRFSETSVTHTHSIASEYELAEFPDPENEVTPKKKFTNFLKRAKPKYDPSAKLRERRRATTTDIPVEVIERKIRQPPPVIPEVAEPTAPDTPPSILEPP